MSGERRAYLLSRSMMACGDIRVIARPGTVLVALAGALLAAGMPDGPLLVLHEDDDGTWRPGVRIDSIADLAGWARNPPQPQPERKSRRWPMIWW